MKRLYRSRKDKKISGLCAGIAEYFNLDPTLIRFALLFLILVAGTGLLLYIIGSIVVPEAPAGDDSFVSYYEDHSRNSGNQQ